MEENGLSFANLTSPGVFQYDQTREIEARTFELPGVFQPPQRCPMTAIISLRSHSSLDSHAL